MGLVQTSEQELIASEDKRKLAHLLYNFDSSLSAIGTTHLNLCRPTSHNRPVARREVVGNCLGISTSYGLLKTGELYEASFFPSERTIFLQGKTLSVSDDNKEENGRQKRRSVGIHYCVFPSLCLKFLTKTQNY